MKILTFRQNRELEDGLRMKRNMKAGSGGETVLLWLVTAFGGIGPIVAYAIADER